MKEKVIFINNCLPELRKKLPSESVVDADFIRFQDGTGKVVLPTVCRGQDVFIVCDINDRQLNPYSNRPLYPDEHIRDITRVIGALKENPARINLIIPFQPYGRQHRRVLGESIEAADFLRECHYLGFHNILTVDSHHPDIAAAISKHNFDNMYPTNQILIELVKREKIDYTKPEDILIVAPDEGAQLRARHFADRFGCNHAFFSKRRDVTRIVDGKNPIESRQYVGFSPENKQVMIVDDMISSGSTIIDTALEVKERGAEKVYVCATFGLFTKGTEAFIKAYEEGVIAKTYITNLTYLKEQPMDGIEVIDGTEQLLECMHALHRNQEDISEELGTKFVPVEQLVRKRVRR